MSAKRVLTDRQSAIPALAEAFREHGFEGASLTLLSKASGLGKGSLYNFFPGGKEEMMEAVLADIDRWFADAIFAPLETADDPRANIQSMIAEVTAYFRSGRRVCVAGCLGLSSSGEAFAEKVRSYFVRWIAALTHCLSVGGVSPVRAGELAEEAVSGIQGAIVLARAVKDDGVFARIVDRQRRSLIAEMSRED